MKKNLIGSALLALDAALVL